MRKIVLFGLGLLMAPPSFARQADREADRYVGSRGTASDDGLVVEWRADRVIDSMRGVASVYRDNDRYRPTSNGERYDPSAMTAAHASFPFDSMVRVTDPETDRRVVVRINDRLDRNDAVSIRLSAASAVRLGFDIAGGREDEVRIELLSSRDVPAVVITRQYERSPSAAGAEASPVADRSDAASPAVQHDASPPTPVRRVSGHEGRSEDSFTLQIGAFSTLDAARRLAADVEGAWVMQVLEDGDRVYRVYYGQYDREAKARVAQERLRKRGRDSFLRRIPD